MSDIAYKRELRVLAHTIMLVFFSIGTKKGQL